MLNSIDYTVIVIYFGILVGLGFYLQRKASASLEDYFLGGRSLPWWALGISGMASWLDIAGTMIITSFLFMLGPRGLYVELRGGVGLAMVAMLLWSGKWHRRSQCMTAAEWMLFRFGKGFGGQLARIMMALSECVFVVGMLAYMIKGVGLFLSTFAPQFTPLQCSMILIGIAMLYTMASGFYGVVFTDIFQSGVILIAVVTITVITVKTMAGGEQLAALAQTVTGNGEWTSAFPHWNTTMPAGYKGYENLGGLALFFLFHQLFLGSGMGENPQYLGSRSDRECGLMSFMWSHLMVFRWPLMMGLAILGIFLVSQLFPNMDALAQTTEVIQQYDSSVVESEWPQLLSDILNRPEKYPVEMIDKISKQLGPDWKEKLPMVSFYGNVNPEKVLPVVILHHIPTGMRGLILIALIAASMSTFDSTVNKATGYFVRDLYQGYFRPKAKNRELIAMSWAFIVLIVIIGFLFAYTVKSINDIWAWVIAGFWGSMIVPRVLRFYWWRFNGGGFAVTVAVGLTAAILQRVLYPDLSDRIIYVWMLGIGLTACVIGTYLTPPTDEKVLENFYMKTRPFGFWGPFKKKLTAEQRALTSREHRNDLLAVPFTMCWHISWLMLPIVLLIRNFQAFWTILAIWAIGLTGMYFFWYRNLPKKNYYPEQAKAGEAIEE